MAWHRNAWAGIVLRLAGLVLLGGATLAARALPGAARAAAHGGAIYVLATVAFLGGCAGAALLALGAHLFDEVEISERWARFRPNG